MSLKNHSDLHTSLRKMFPIGSRIPMDVVSVSRSGMSRKIAVYHVNDNREIVNVSREVAELLGYSFDRNTWAIKINGCGMDMCFAIAYALGQELYDGSRSKKLQRNLNPHPGYALKYYSI